MRALLLVAIAALALACGPAAAPPLAPSGENLQPQSGGTFNVTVLASPSHLFPFSDTTTANQTTIGPVYETLMKYDYSGDYRDDLKVLPNLAERWERTDPTTYVFTLRKGVRFHDGSDLAAEDVVFSFNHMRDPANRFRRAPVLAPLDRIEMVDPYTVRMTTKGAAPTFIDRVTDRYPVVLSKKAFERDVDFEKEAIGTGPFKIGTWDRRSGTTLVKHDGYWQSGRPYLDKVQFFYNFDFAGSIAAFTAGRNDVVKVSNKTEFDQIKVLNPEAKGESFNQNNSTHMIFKNDRPPFNDIRVRRAIHLAIDRNDMNDTLSSGLALVNPPGMNPGRKGWALSQDELAKLPGYRKPKEPDVAEAKRLLTEAGQPNGFKFTFAYGTDVTRRASEAQVVAAHLSKVGLQMELSPKEGAVNNKLQADDDFQATFATFGYDPDASDWPFWLHSKQAKARAGIDDRDLDQFIEAQAVELDSEKRRQQWIGVQRLLLDKLYVVPLISQEGFVAFQPYVHGWGDNRAGQPVNQAWDSTWLQVDRVVPGR